MNAAKCARLAINAQVVELFQRAVRLGRLRPDWLKALALTAQRAISQPQQLNSVNPFQRAGKGRDLVTTQA
jgi:hypothetical protein